LRSIEEKAEQLAEMLKNSDNRISLELMNLSSRVGGGALPLQDLPSKCVGVKVKGMSVNQIEKFMRNHIPPIIGRIEDDAFIMDMRTVATDELPLIQKAFADMLAGL